METTGGNIIIHEGMLMVYRTAHRLRFGVAGKDSVKSLGAGLSNDPDALAESAEAARRMWLLCVATEAALPFADGHDQSGLTFESEEKAIEAGAQAIAACRQAILAGSLRLLDEELDHG
jgi:hypothetical protein